MGLAFAMMLGRQLGLPAAGLLRRAADADTPAPPALRMSR